MLKLTIEDAQVMTCNETTLQLQSGERRKQECLIMVTTRNGVETYQVEVWDDNIEKCALKPSETVTLHAGVQTRLKDGRWYNTIVVYRAERGAAQNVAAQTKTEDIF